MTTDQKVELAKVIATEIMAKWREAEPGRIPRYQESSHARRRKFSSNEWMRWVSYFNKEDLPKALELANYLARSPAIRPDPQRAARCIVQVLRARLNQLQCIPTGELAEVFGYVGRWLEWLKQETQP
jgi:hypothetical protein